MRLALALLLVSAVPALAQQGAAGPSAEVLARVAPAVLRITASGCQGTTPERGATGFAWERPGQIVTALHVVVGCQTIKVGYQGLAERPATLAHVLRDADLVLLDVSDPPDLTALQIATRQLAVNEVVDVYGFPLGTPTRENHHLVVTDANRETPFLREALSPEALNELRQSGFPSLSTEVLRVEGHLLPGHSGAPVIDTEGKVVAVGSGGLERGTVGIGWAVRAHYVADLPKASSETASLASVIPATQFAFAPSQASAASQSIRCGALTFVRTRRRRLDQLLASSDDPSGFRYLVNATGTPLQQIAGLWFDVWTESSGGAGVALPAGSHPQAIGEDCTVTLIPNVLAVHVSGGLLPEPSLAVRQSLVDWVSAVQEVSQAFEARQLAPFLPSIRPDPNFTYRAPQLRGAAIVNRKQFIGPEAQGPAHIHGVFETLLMTRRSFVGIAVLDRFVMPTPFNAARLHAVMGIGSLWHTFLDGASGFPLRRPGAKGHRGMRSVSMQHFGLTIPTASISIYGVGKVPRKADKSHRGRPVRRVGAEGDKSWPCRTGFWRGFRRKRAIVRVRILLRRARATHS